MDASRSGSASRSGMPVSKPAAKQGSGSLTVRDAGWCTVSDAGQAYGVRLRCYTDITHFLGRYCASNTIDFG